MPSEIFKVRKRAPLLVKKSNVYAKLSSRRIGELVDRARAISKQLDEVKPLYNELDEITFALLNAKESLAVYGATLVDRFAAKNTAFKTVGIRRWEIEFVNGRK